MTLEESRQLTLLQTRVRQLILSYRELGEKYAKATEALRQSRAENESLKAQCQALNEEMARAKAARIVEVCSEDAKAARDRIHRIIREVDRCIALLGA